MPNITTVIACPHGQMRRAMRQILEREPDFDVMDEAGDGPATQALVAALRPRILLLDATLAGYDNLALITALQTAMPGTHIISLCDDHVAGHFRLGAGAAGYVLVRHAGQCLVETIHRVAAGMGFHYPDAATQARPAARPHRPAARPLQPASRRQ